MTGWLGVVAFVLVVLELAAACAGLMLARRFWRQVEPTVRPMLAMFTPPPGNSTSSRATVTITDSPPEIVGGP